MGESNEEKIVSSDEELSAPLEIVHGVPLYCAKCQDLNSIYHVYVDVANQNHWLVKCAVCGTMISMIIKDIEPVAISADVSGNKN